MKNPVIEVFDIDENSLQSQKKDTVMHGWGIKNVKQIVEENHGEMQYICKDGIFNVNITFMEGNGYE